MTRAASKSLLSAFAIACFVGVVSAPGSVRGMDYRSLILSHGPVSYWRLGETSGTTAADEMGANNGSYVNGVTLNQNGPLIEDTNPAASFDGWNDYVGLGTMSVSGSALTMLGWFRADDFDNPNAPILAKGNGTSISNIWWGLGSVSSYGQRLAAVLKTSSTTQIATSSTTITAGQWIFVAGVYNGSTLKVYQNGVEVGSVALTGTVSTSGSVGVRIGSNPSNVDFFDGTIDEVAIFNKALTAAQLLEIYKVGRGLVGRWRLDETSGTSAADSSPYNNDGTLYGGLSFSSHSVAGQYNRALSFNGSSHYVSVANASSLQLTNGLTLAAWIKGDAWGSGTDVDTIIRKGEANPNNYQLSIADGRVSLHLNQNDDGGYRGDTILETGRWYHVAATWDGAEVKIYVNGQLDASPTARTGTIPTDTRALYLGGRSGADYFDGALDEPRVYNYALDQNDINRLYGLMAHWKLDEGSGSTVSDSSGNNYHATRYGGATWTTGKDGGAIDFDGSGDYVLTNASFPPPSETSLAFWLKPGGTPATHQRVLGISSSWEVRHHTTGELQFDLNAGDGPLTNSALTDAGKWRHVVAVFSSANDTYAIYLDGQLHKSGAWTLTSQSGGQLAFGVRTGTTEYWDGQLDDIRVYDRLLTAEEAENLGSSRGIRVIKWLELQ